MSHPAPGVGTRPAVLAGAVALGALVLVLLVVQWSGHPQAPFRPGPIDAVDAVVEAAGLEVCSVTDEPDPRANQAIASRTYSVAVSCPAPGALVVVDQFADVSHRDATARDLTARTRPRGSGVVYTFGDLTVLVEGAGEDEVQDRLDAALREAGAR